MQSVYNNFLSRVAQRYLELSNENSGSVCIIFPNRRASLFFRKELFALKAESQWMPEIFSAEEFVTQCMQQYPIDSITALFEFYTVYKKTEAEAADPFDVFLTWAPQLLHDFEEVDLYLIDAKQLYKTVNAAYAMERWSPDRQTITPTQEAYLHFWSMMGTWYSQYRAHLNAKSLCTTGSLYRKLAEEISERGNTMHWSKMLFCGFSALNTAENRIVRFLEKTGRAEILWDIDAYYLDDTLNEAGHFFRRFKNDWAAHTFKNIPERLDRPSQQFECIGVAKNMGQVIEAGSILNSLIDSNETLEDTAVVLSDERLLMPMLEVLPEALPSVNVTMSYPLYQLPILGIFTTVFELQRRAKTSTSKDAVAFYFRDLLKLLRHSGIRQILGDGFCKDYISRINKSSHKYMQILDWYESAELEQKLGFIFKPWMQSSSAAIQCLQQLTKKLAQYASQEDVSAVYQSEALEQSLKLLNKIEQYNLEFPDILNIASLQRVFTQLSRQLSLPFYGEPLSGLQLMGLLETRNVDFKNLIVLSVNEGILPASRAHRSFIPFDIAAGLGLPTYRDRDALFAYHFYRMIQGAERVWLIYNTEHDEFGKGEQSRFITQLEQELKHASFRKTIRIPELPAHVTGSMRVEKTPELIEQLKKRYRPEENTKNRGLSATGLKSFVKCSFSFYLYYLTGVKPEIDRDDKVEANKFGNILHKALQYLFTPLIGKVIRAQDIESMYPKMISALTEAFYFELKVNSIESGAHTLTFETLKNMLERYLKWEQGRLAKQTQEGKTTRIVALETELTTVRTIRTGGDEFTIKLMGLADRIDEMDGFTYILDYKTGYLGPKELEFETFEDVFTHPDYEKAMQLFYYQMLYADSHPHSRLQSGIVPMKKPSDNLQIVKQPEADNPNDIIEQHIMALIERIFDQSEPFEQTEDEKQCVYCNFKGMCNRN
jgi:ATP-dependent helicase/nuclease subunit B